MGARDKPGDDAMSWPLLLAARLTLPGKSTLHFGRYRNNAVLGKGVLLTGSFDSESCYVTVGFALPTVRRCDGVGQRYILRWSGADHRRCGCPAFPDIGMVVIAGTFSPPASFVHLNYILGPCCVAIRDLGPRDEHREALHLQRAGGGATASLRLRPEWRRARGGGAMGASAHRQRQPYDLLPRSGFEPVAEQR